MSKNTVYWVIGDVNPALAGYRVRTLPIAKALESFSIKPVIISNRELVETVQKIAEKAAVVIIAKPNESELLLCMKYLLANDVRVLADFFDNYFSWSSALYKLAVPWQLLSTIQATSGIIVSTPALENTFKKLGFSDVCLVSDPPPGKLPAINETDGVWLNLKWDNPQQIELLWFGISSNPYFNAGIDDLISWGRVVSYINGKLSPTVRVRLTLCTNRVAAVEAAIIYFNNLGINTRFVEWQEKVCDNLIRESHLVLIPSNLSLFSVSKTHNRCSDALKHQCLVLSSPNGPYHEIPGAVYRDVNKLCDDLVNLDLSHITALLNQSRDYLAKTHALSIQAYHLAKFINKKAKPINKMSVSNSHLPSILIVGCGASAACVKLSRRLGYLSISARDFEFKLNFDFLFTALDVNQATATIELNAAAKQALVSLQNNNQWDEEGLHTNSFAIQEANGASVVIVQLPELQYELQAIAELRAIARTHSNLRERLYELNTTVITVAIAKLGFNKLDFSANESVGWDSYIKYGNTDLDQARNKLEQLWLENELQDFPNQSKPVQIEGACNA